MINLLWLQSGCCGGSTISFLNANQPDILTALEMLGARFVWHPGLSPAMGEEVLEIFDRFKSEEEKLDVLMVEGTIYHGPNGTGKYFIFHDRPFKNWILDLVKVAHYTMAIGICSSFGGIPAASNNPMEATGLQFLHEKKGGLLGPNYMARSGLPVVNIAGCPAHPDWIVETLIALVSGKLDISELDKYQRPKVFYNKLAHHACPRNEYYEFKASAERLTHEPEGSLQAKLEMVARAYDPCISCSVHLVRLS